jgi:hypothetical protein
MTKRNQSTVAGQSGSTSTLHTLNPSERYSLARWVAGSKVGTGQGGDFAIVHNAPQLMDWSVHPARPLTAPVATGATLDWSEADLDSAPLADIQLDEGLELAGQSTADITAVTICSNPLNSTAVAA